MRQWFKAQQLRGDAGAGPRASSSANCSARARPPSTSTRSRRKAGFGKADDLFAAVGRGELNPRQIQTAIRAVVQPRRRADAEAAAEVLARQSKAAGAGSGILVVGVDQLMTELARCCKPAPPDPIVGFVTRGKGVSIHRAELRNVARMRAREPERLIAADWGAPRDEVFPVDIVLEAMDRQGLLRDITEVLSRERINVTAANTLTRNSADAAWRSRSR